MYDLFLFINETVFPMSIDISQADCEFWRDYYTEQFTQLIIDIYGTDAGFMCVTLL